MKVPVMYGGVSRLLSAAAAMLLLAVLMSVGNTKAEAAVVRLVAVGDTAPVSPAATFTGFDEPMVNVLGDSAFVGFLSDSREGVALIPNGGALASVAVSGDTIGTLGTLSTDFDGPAINNQRTVIFVNRGMTGGSTTAALFMKKFGKPVAALLKQGDAAPGTAGVFSSFDDMSLNNIGDAAVIATYTEDAGATFKTGVFVVSHTGAISATLLNGDALPGTGGGVFGGIDREDVDGPWINDTGSVAFSPDVISGGPGGFEGSMFVRVGKGPIKSFVLIGDAIPAPVGGTVASIATGRPGLDNSNTLAIGLEITGGSTGTAIATKVLGGSIKVCASDGQAIPDPASPGTFSSPSGPSIVNHVAEFHSDIAGDPNNNGGIFYCHQGVPHKLVLQGDTKPGGGTYNSLEEESTSGNYGVFDDEGGTPDAIYRASIQPGGQKN